MYVIVDEMDQIWGVCSTQEKADKYIEENSEYPRRLRRIYAENLDEETADAELEAELIGEGYTEAEIKEALTTTAKDDTYNGWTNYATWRIALEIFDGQMDDFEANPEQLKDYVEELLEMDCSNDLTLSYANAFISDVNFYEIAEHIEDYNKGESQAYAKRKTVAERSYPLEELNDCLGYKAEQAAKELTSVDGEDLNEIGKDALSLIKKVEKAILKY